MTRRVRWPLAALSFCLAVLAGCASEPGPSCGTVYTLGEAEAAQAIARGQTVTKPGPVPAHAVPRGTPRGVLEPDGSYAGGRVFCSAAEARAAAPELVAQGVLPEGRSWRVYIVAAEWDKDVYEKRPGEYRLRRPARITQVAN
ncbi:MAG TPA: DVU_2496 family lipoprotein [Burkholderiales bacterium]|nr:DVU_2496 family lipoprotein [Burkholderiales bacterium]